MSTNLEIMELVLAKIYLVFVFGILLTLSAFLISWIQLRQNLEKRLFFIQKIQDNSYINKFKLGQLYLRKNLYKKAIEEFRNCFNLWDKNDRLGMSSLFNTIGYTYFLLSEFELAIYYYTIALEIAPDNIICLENLFYLYKVQNNIEKVNLVAQRILEFDTKYSKSSEIKEVLEKMIRDRNSRI